MWATRDALGIFSTGHVASCVPSPCSLRGPMLSGRLAAARSGNGNAGQARRRGSMLLQATLPPGCVEGIWGWGESSACRFAQKIRQFKLRAGSQRRISCGPLTSVFEKEASCNYDSLSQDCVSEAI